MTLHDLDLQLLNFRKPLPLVEQEVIHLFVEMADLELGLQVDAIVVERPHPVFGFLPSLAHHDDRCLYGGYARENEVEQYEGIRVKAAWAHDVKQDPECQPEREKMRKFQLPPKLARIVGSAF